MKRAGLHLYSREALAALECFLSQVVLPDKRARYIDLASRPNSRRKFLNAMHHELEVHLDPAKRVDALSPALLHSPGFRFSPYDDCFGDEVDTLANVVSSHDESFLVVSTDGRVGIHGPESFVDRRAFYTV